MIPDPRLARQKTWIELSRKNLRHNLGVFRRLCGKATPIWTVKANAYGHGAGLIAKEIQKTVKKSHGEWFGVDSLDEAINLRQEGISAPIIVLGWVPYPRLGELIKYNLRLLLSSEQTLKELSKLKNRAPLRIHLKIDTGATRQGVLPNQALTLAKKISAAGMVLEGAAMHFANIEDVDNPIYADLQLERFARVIALLRADGYSLPVVHAACSAAAMTRPETVFTAARIGIGLYGLNPSQLVADRYKKQKRGAALQPVLTWRARIGLLKWVPAGTPVGYGLTEKTTRATKIAIVPVGYADGYDRSLSSRGKVLIAGVKCRVIGRVCMNMIIVDATPARRARENGMVTLIGVDGPCIAADELAALAGTINYEIVARLAERLFRIVI